MKGVNVYKTKDGFTVAQLHYTADPKKDPEREGQQWLQNALKGVPGGRSSAMWRKEMEIDFSAYSGQLLCHHIINEYRDKIVREKYVKGTDKIFAGFDWGRNNPSSFHLYAVDENNNIHSFNEVYLNDTSIENLATIIKSSPYFNRIIWIAADPSLWSRTQEEKSGLRSLNDRFYENGIFLTKSKGRDDNLAISELLDRWNELSFTTPQFTISPQCVKQVWEFERLRYKEVTTAMIEKLNPYESLMDKDNHSWDDFKYFINTWVTPPDLKYEQVAEPGSPLDRLQRRQRERAQRSR